METAGATTCCSGEGGGKESALRNNLSQAFLHIFLSVYSWLSIFPYRSRISLSLYIFINRSLSLCILLLFIYLSIFLFAFTCLPMYIYLLLYLSLYLSIYPPIYQLSAYSIMISFPHQHKVHVSLLLSLSCAGITRTIAPSRSCFSTFSSTITPRRP